MMLLWISVAALTALTLALLIAPLLLRRTRPAPSRRELDLRIYRQQLAEVDHDVERGLLAPAEAEAARTEVKRRMLALNGDAVDAQAAMARPKANARHRFIAAACALTIPLAALGLYLFVGAPGETDQPLAARGTAPAGMAAGDQSQGGTQDQASSMEQAVAQLAQRMESRPDDREGWALLGRAYLGMGRFEGAAAALRRAHELAPDRPEIAAAYGEAAVAAAEGRVTPDAASAFTSALDRDPREPRARFYLGLAKAQRGDVAGALQDWVDLVAISPADAPWLASVREQIAKAAAELGVDIASVQPSARAISLGTAPAAPGPSAGDVKAAEQMSEGDRGQMIRSMVERLAAKLNDNPDDRQGWLRLARAYQVLGEPEKAAQAQARADALDKR